MPAIGPALGALIKSKVNDYMKTAYPYGGPLAGKVTSYYIEFCMAIGLGIASKSLGKINWASTDIGMSGTPSAPGVGIGKGILVDKKWFAKNLYLEMMTNFPHLPAWPPATKTTEWTDEFDVYHKEVVEVHPPFPPKSDYSNGMFMECICTGIADSVESHFKTAWIMQGTHPKVYMGKGKVNEGKFFGLVGADIASGIQAMAPSMSGPYWIKLTNAIGKVYVDAIHKHSKSGPIVISGVCVPSQSQVCGIPGGGIGTGKAL